MLVGADGCAAGGLIFSAELAEEVMHVELRQQKGKTALPRPMFRAHNSHQVWIINKVCCASGGGFAARGIACFGGLRVFAALAED